jgi:deoxyinosine 3'endonuclease (endonuclease V)
MAKLKYNLKNKYQKETNRLGSVDISYDATDDEIYMALALRKDVKDAELIDRIVRGIKTSFGVVTGEIEPDLCKESEDVMGYAVKVKKGK